MASFEQFQEGDKMEEEFNPYKILGVEEDASEEEINNAFRKLAKELHPDVPGGSTEKFQEIESAYRTCIGSLNGKKEDNSQQASSPNGNVRNLTVDDFLGVFGESKDSSQE
ncbi:MAG: J domain-containing protein [Candidatus Spechtbacterales bacterium]